MALDCTLCADLNSSEQPFFLLCSGSRQAFEFNSQLQNELHERAAKVSAMRKHHIRSRANASSFQHFCPAFDQSANLCQKKPEAIEAGR